MEEPQISTQDLIEMVRRTVEENRFTLGDGEITGRFFCGRILKNDLSVGVVVIPIPILGDYATADAVIKAAVREALAEAVSEPGLRQ